MKTDYAKILRDKHEQWKTDQEDRAAIGLTEYRARRDIERWRARLAEHLKTVTRPN